MQECTSLAVIGEHLTADLRGALLRADLRGMTELRLNSGRAAAAIFPDKVRFLTSRGLTASHHNLGAVSVTSADISRIVESLSHYSIHSCSREFRQGFFALKGGVRVGISGVFNSEGYINQVTGLNFRVARCVPGCADELLPLIEKGSLLICGEVNSGKTTILRELCRLTGDRRKVSLIDERNEVANVYGGELMNDVGALTNVLTGCGRSEGIVAAVRTLSPEVIFCDEVSTDGDCSAIIRSAGCGVRFCATIHAGSYEDLIKRPIGLELVRSGIFSNAVFLAGAAEVGKIREIRGIDRHA